MHHIEATSAQEFMAHLFFRQNSIVPEEILRNMYIHVLSKIDLKAIQYTPTGLHDYLDLWHLNYDVTIYFYYTKLNVMYSFLNPMNLQADHLIGLKIENDFIPIQLFDILKSSHLLTELEVLQSRKAELEPLSIDLSVLPAIENFTKLAFSNVHIGSTRFIELNDRITFKSNAGKLNTTLISLSGVLHLQLSDTVLVEKNLDTLLRTTRLSSLRLDYRKTLNTNFDLTSIAKSAHSLISLDLFGLELLMSLQSFPVISRTRFAIFNKCHFRETMFPNRFNKIFPNLTSLEITESNTSFALLQDILSIPTLDWVRVSFSLNGYKTPEMNKFLFESSVPEDECGFQLKRSNKSSTGWVAAGVVHPNSRSNPRRRDVALYTYVLVLVTISGIGILGNVLSAVVLTRKNMWGSTSCILLGLAFCDSLVLITYASSMLYNGIKLVLVFLRFQMSIIDTEVTTFLGYPLTESSVKWLDEFQYFFLYPINKTAYTGSVYATVLLTIEGYVAVCWPLHSRRLLRPKMAVYLILFVLSFAAVLNLPRWIEAQQFVSTVHVYRNVDWLGGMRNILNFERTTQGSGLLRYRYYRDFYHGVTWIPLMYFLPISALTLLNFKILRQLRISKQNRASITSTRRNDRNSGNTEDVQLALLTKMLLYVIMIFVICNATSGLIIFILMWTGGWDPADIEVFSCIPLILNSSINFLIYVLLGSKFRAELCRLISVWKNVCRIGPRNPAAGQDLVSQLNTIPLRNS